MLNFPNCGFQKYMKVDLRIGLFICGTLNRKSDKTNPSKVTAVRIMENSCNTMTKGIVQ